ncbi:hypothetical protein HKX15_17825 [Sulfitobacter sp. KE37]|uniref:hypothetical protein n=1 Tax=unclassified Sulfitobacter TaxID=196795 RepID=UPI0023E29253|nr:MULTISPECIES: hypothetical protein [unclassified Sulfitobacter]MDF3352004.1 hypothetical protein [Sulfitobacter sp. KE12]MDF3355675.1 hypothetical protein [Sulfitobacter sp. KE27]MDF3370356.1 hypothetical protein [Sulfitobacter sp. Ks43]MDF3374007.1 hypothetical protein [Sulfitobacter sp. KS8]MDF3377641.1 hypothetical protein [Sulfitobacter sp. KE37]
MSKERIKKKRHYYARYCDWGINVIFESNNGTVDYFPGDVLRFKTRRARDAWVADEVWDGTWRREALSARDLRRARKLEERRWYSAGRGQRFEGEAINYEVLD